MLSASSCSAPNLPTRETVGLAKTACWFDTTDYLPTHTCYTMTVDETPGQLNGRMTSFPVIVFSSLNDSFDIAPLLHLGGGGPGGSLYLESEYNVFSIYDQMRSLSVDMGRDLYLIDPRGAGQSSPSMMCQRFVDNVIPRWRKKLSLRESYDSGHHDFQQCLETLKRNGTDFSAYNSTTVVQDLERLRQALDVKQWVLYGASYASVYAQIYARDYPGNIEAMILDSATFLDTPRHEVLVQETVEPYKRLFDYCTYTQSCSQEHSQDHVAQAFWQQVRALDKKPLKMSVEHPYSDKEFTTYLTGWRFLDSMLWGVYGEDIFTDYPVIMKELERGETKSIKPYLEELLAYLLDETFGDISASSHYCVDSKPYINEEKIREQVEAIPYAYARDIARMGLEYTDYCGAMNISSVRGVLDQAVVTDVPTLFVHGTYDSVTLLEHVTDRKQNFSNSHIVTSSQAHIVLDDPCVQKTAEAFLKNGLDTTLTQHCTPP